jgi:hypothetical protein
MTMMQCEYRDHVITAEVMEHPGTPTPWAGGCRISNPQGQVTRRMALPVGHAFMAELEQAQRASIAHGKWLVDQYLDNGWKLFEKAALISCGPRPSRGPLLSYGHCRARG